MHLLCCEEASDRCSPVWVSMSVVQASHKPWLVVLAETLRARKANLHPGNECIPVRKNHRSYLDPKVVSSSCRAVSGASAHYCLKAANPEVAGASSLGD